LDNYFFFGKGGDPKVYGFFLFASGDYGEKKDR
jgi:hypothetical protein